MKKIYYLSLVVFILAFASCATQKEVAYFNGVNSSSADSINKKFNKVHEARICTGDMLSITVTGLNPSAVAPFNLPLVSYATPGSEQLSATPTLQSYLVDINGDIDFPVIGVIKLSGLSKSQAIKYLNEQLAPHLKD